MALLAEELVEEWLNRNGFFTIRGIKVGVYEIDLLAIGFKNGETICRHIEVQDSVNPISYLCPLPKEYQKLTGRGPNNAKIRSEIEISTGVKEWVEKKYHLPATEKLRKQLYDGDWKFELIVNQVRHEEELKLIEEHGILIYRLENIISELASSKTIVKRASGSALVDLVMIGKPKQQKGSH